VAKALSPARVREVLVDDEDKQATVVVPDDQLSLAIGREGQNARLAAKLTGWRVDIKSETEFSQEEEDIDIEGAEEVDGRCGAVLSAGRRCPNASLPGSRYCGLPQHQALARFDTNQVGVLATLSDEEIATLADPAADEGAVSPLVERASAALQEEPEEEEVVAAEEPAEESEAEETETATVEETEEVADEDVELVAEGAVEPAAEEPEAAEEPAEEPEVADEPEAEEEQEPAEEPDAEEEPEPVESAEEELEPEEALAADAETEGPGA
jgi:N utilization substance protein A